jgi:hypothetical protein
MDKVSQMLRICTLIIVSGNVMLCGSGLFAVFMYL